MSSLLCRRNPGRSLRRRNPNPLSSRFGRAVGRMAVRSQNAAGGRDSRIAAAYGKRRAGRSPVFAAQPIAGGNAGFPCSRYRACRSRNARFHRAGRANRGCAPVAHDVACGQNAAGRKSRARHGTHGKKPYRFRRRKRSLLRRKRKALLKQSGFSAAAAGNRNDSLG